MTSSDKELKNIFKRDHPLGPAHIKDRSHFVDELLVRDNLPFRRLIQNPTFLIGRKGSGKSSLLYSAYLDSSSISLELPSDDLFKEVVQLINSNTDEYTSVEQVESIWSFSFWAAIAVRILKHALNENVSNQHVETLKKFTEGLNLNVKDHPFRTILKALNHIKKNQDDGLSFEQAARYSAFNNITRSDIELSVGELLSLEELELRVLIDSLEEYKLDSEGSLPAISGFIRFIGQFTSFSSNVYIQCALPTEVYFPIIESISSNPAKDFSRCELVHWTAPELLYLAARRLAVFLRLTAPELYLADIAPIENRRGRHFSRAFWARILPKTISNGLGIPEAPEAYIIRHTQLSPRHVIIYFNEIIRTGLDYILSGEIIPESIIVEAIKNTESTLCDDVFAGWTTNYNYEDVQYQYHGYPRARDLCNSLIRYLPCKFRYDEFRKIYKKHVADSITYISDANDALKLFAELGIIGRVTNAISRSDRYIRAEFEYALPSHLIYTNSSEFCLHPAFIGTFGSEDNHPNPPYAIYPIGSDPDEPDYRASWE